VRFGTEFVSDSSSGGSHDQYFPAEVSVRSFDKPVSGAAIAASIGRALARAALRCASTAVGSIFSPSSITTQDRHRDVA